MFADKCGDSNTHQSSNHEHAPVHAFPGIVSRFFAPAARIEAMAAFASVTHWVVEYKGTEKLLLVQADSSAV